MKILVTGGTGYLGRRLIERLCADKHYVSLFHRASSDLSPLKGLPVEFRAGELTSVDDLTRAMKGVEWVFHVAGNTSPKRSDKKALMETNVFGTRAVVAAAIRAQVKRLIHTSSIAAIGFPMHGEGNEQTQFLKPSGSITYFLTKHLAEKEVQGGIAQGLDAVFANPGFILGPGDDDFSSGGKLILRVAKQKVPLSPPGGICLIDVDDVVEGHIRLATRGKRGERYILGGKNITYVELFRLISKNLNVPYSGKTISPFLLQTIGFLSELISSLFGGKPYITYDEAKISSYKFFFDSSKAQKELGMTFRSPEEIVNRTIDYYKSKNLICS